MGNVMTCFERWGKRQPDGPLLTLKPGENKKGSLLSSFSTSSTASSASRGRSPSPSVPNSPSAADLSAGKGSRSSRRRPTYASNKKKSDTEVSSMEEELEDESEDLGDASSARDIRLKRISEHRRMLTKVVKLKTAIFSETVKVTVAKDGSQLEWYKGKSKTDETQMGKKRPSGSFPIDKITSVKAKSDNPKVVEVCIQNPAFETFFFTFKSRDDRELWQQHLDSFRKFMSMK